MSSLERFASYVVGAVFGFAILTPMYSEIVVAVFDTHPLFRYVGLVFLALTMLCAIGVFIGFGIETAADAHRDRKTRECVERRAAQRRTWEEFTKFHWEQAKKAEREGDVTLATIARANAESLDRLSRLLQTNTTREERQTG